ncbi:hypothetical protein EHQ68_04620 [Leptospira congkakensis]|uniref:Uncharacterized protein n=1 Tax=Leptospira congkakensis TaxID=2484932 RepID=A0A4Z1A7Q8_9LEPT|nr:hypothetical protein [Leptospira congkakensis]TGL90712.1 hypothetical protein EHQ69_12380 [Leptospira congkakensis]TGL91719.1 hypothetical protein EHQ68_04620 [Leptospira congkakensis]TGL98772.1 hypothetical protein EHQ70_04205 [Leptospira congkakensis]
MFFLSFGCEQRYLSNPDFCALMIADGESLKAEDLAKLNAGLIASEEYERLVRLRENSTLTICALSILKTKENQNF